MRYGSAVFACVMLACGDSRTVVEPPPPPEPVIAKLLVADPDTGFWLGETLALSGLVTGAVTANGDTVAPPPVAWTVPDGFVRDGDLLAATREARGRLVATVQAVPTVSASIQAATMTDLAARGQWAGGYRCYGGAWDATRSTDSILYEFHEGHVHYSEAPWAPGTFQALFQFDSIHQVAYLSDGSVHTLGFRPNNGERHLFHQDTLSLRVVAGPDTVPMRQVTGSPIEYLADAPICTVETGWQRDGTPWRLSAQ